MKLLLAHLLNRKLKDLILLIAVFLLLSSAFLPDRGAAAQQPDFEWSEPINLSNAGLSQLPVMAVDRGGKIHVFWYDELAGNRYASSTSGADWDSPVTLNLPFGEFRPRFYVSPGNFIYAFWLDDDGNLLVSRVQTSRVDEPEAWSPEQLVMEAVVSYHFAEASNGDLHLVFATNAQVSGNAPGIFFSASSPDGSVWNLPQQVYSSLYFRALTSDNAPGLAVAAAQVPEGEDLGAGRIFVAWDEPAFQRVVVSSSSDGGDTWDPIQVVDRSADLTGSARPAGVEMAAWNNEVMMLWKKSSAGVSCSVNYKTTVNRGEAWADVQQLDAAWGACPSNSAFIGEDENFLVWYAVSGEQVWISAWNGQQWSRVRQLPELTSFKDPKTSRTLKAGCQQLIYWPEVNQIRSTFCDENGNQDIWYTSTSSEGITGWFSQGSAWQKPLQIHNVPGRLSSLNLISGNNEIFYALWLQPDLASNVAKEGGSIPGQVMYSQWDGSRWSQPTGVKRVPERAQGLSVTHSGKNELVAVWLGEEQGQIYSSRANANRAFNAGEWSEPTRLPAARGVSSDPLVAAGEDDDLYVFYAVRINEGRGLYVIRSQDHGHSWNETVQIFDAQEAGWELVKQPSVFISAGGRIHVLWQHGSLLHQDSGYGLGYAYSDDGGATWSKPDLGVDAKVQWAAISGSSDGQLIRAWQEIKSGIPVLFTQVSSDNGGSWQSPNTVTFSGELMGNPRLVADPRGNIYFMQALRNPSGQMVLLTWYWSADTWKPGETLVMKHEDAQAVIEVHGSISPGKQLGVIYSVDSLLTNSRQRLVYGVLGRAGGDLDQEPILLPINAQTPEPIQDSSIEATEPAAQPTPTRDLVSGIAVTDGDSQSKLIKMLIYGSALSVVLVFLFIAIKLLLLGRR